MATSPTPHEKPEPEAPPNARTHHSFERNEAGAMELGTSIHVELGATFAVKTTSAGARCNPMVWVHFGSVPVFFNDPVACDSLAEQMKEAAEFLRRDEPTHSGRARCDERGSSRVEQRSPGNTVGDSTP